MRHFSLLAFPKIAPSSLPNRRVHSRAAHGTCAPRSPLRQSAATPPDCSDLVVSRHFAGFLLVDPVRTVAAAHDPGVHRRFTPARFPALSSWFGFRGSSRCHSALRSFPSADSCRRWNGAFAQSRRGGSHLLPDCHPALLQPRCAGFPLRGSSALKPALAIILHVTVPDPCETVRSAHALREFTNRLAVSSFRGDCILRCRHCCDLTAFLHRRVRCPAAVSSEPCPVLPWAWSPPSRS